MANVLANVAVVANVLERGIITNRIVMKLRLSLVIGPGIPTNPEQYSSSATDYSIFV